jgi:hypothetical protein
LTVLLERIELGFVVYKCRWKRLLSFTIEEASQIHSSRDLSVFAAEEARFQTL